MSWGDIPDWADNVAKSLMLAVRAKDPETFSHCVRVGQSAKKLAQAAGLNDYEQKVAEFSGLFHDAGKIAVPDLVLHKPGKLDEHETELMKAHPLRSAELITPFSNDSFFRDLLPGVLHHHERVDGHGYPYGKVGDEVPLIARVLAVVDTFDAMTQDRAYRKGLPEEVANEELLIFSGRQFDAHLVKVFLQASPFWKRQSKVDRSEHSTERLFRKVA